MSSHFIKILDSCPTRLKKKISTGPVIYKVTNKFSVSLLSVLEWHFISFYPAERLKFQGRNMLLIVKLMHFVGQSHSVLFTY